MPNLENNIYDVTYKGETYEVTAPSMESAESAVRKLFTERNMLDTLDNLEKEADLKIIERNDTTFREQINAIKNAQGVTGKFLKSLKLAAMPFERYEASLANVALKLQKGEWDNLDKHFLAGVKGERLGELGDIFRMIDMPEPVASTLGFFASIMSPVALFGRTLKAINGLSKSTDAGLKAAGKSLLRGTDDALEILGKNVDEAYRAPAIIGGKVSSVNKVTGSGDDLLKAFDDAPDDVIKAVEKELKRNIDDIATNPQIEDVRNIKKIVGKQQATSFGKQEIGAIERLRNQNVDKTYGSLKRWIEKTLRQNNLNKEADNLLMADDLFTEASRSSRFIRNKIVDKTLKIPTKASSIAEGLLSRRDLSTREALTALQAAGNASKKNIQFAIYLLDDYNKTLRTLKAGETTIRVLGIGALGGLAGSKAADIQREQRGN